MDMKRLWTFLLRLEIWRDTRGQDLIEYSLLVGFFVVTAAAIFPPIADSVTTIFSKITSIIEQVP